MRCYRCGRVCVRSFDLLRIGGKNVAVCKPSCPRDRHDERTR